MLSITPIRALKDNYIWMFGEEPLRKIWIVDPGEAMPVIEILRANKLLLAGILLTHHHADHSGGIDELLEYAGDIPVYGSVKSPIAAINRPVNDHEQISCGSLDFKVIAIPGHTLDHTAYFNNQALFCGDTLFSAGCGRIFEGTPEQMYTSLGKLMQLDENTKIYCGHEYTLNNLRFALTVEPTNLLIQDKMARIKAMGNLACTLPALLREEKLINPFLRCEQPAIIAAVSQYAGKPLTTPVAVFASLRQWKNSS